VHHRTATTWCMGNVVSRLVHRGARGKSMLSTVVSTCHIKVTVPMAEGGDQTDFRIEVGGSKHSRCCREVGLKSITDLK
jgi:hypothetical protein